MSIILGVAAAFFIGLSDSFGRASSRRDQSSVTHVTTQMFVGTLVALPFTFIIPSSFIVRDIIFGSLSGIFVAMGLAIIYRAMADSSSAITLPLAAVVAIIVPLVWDLATGAALSGLAALGCALAVISLVVVSFDPTMGTNTIRRGLGLAFIGGLLFGLTFLFAGITSEQSGAWPAVFNRGVGLVGILLLALKSGAPLVLERPARKFGLLGGVAGSLGMLALIVGTQIGSLGIVSVLAGSSPAVTVAVTALFDDDSVTWSQMAGVAGAIAGASLIAVGA